MKRILFISVCLLWALVGHAQSIVKDSTKRVCIDAFYIDGIKVSGMKSRNSISPLYIGNVRTDGTIIIKQNGLISLPQRNINAIAGLVAGVDSRAGETPNIRGARQDGTAYFVDGMRIRTLDIPMENNTILMK